MVTPIVEEVRMTAIFPVQVTGEAIVEAVKKLAKPAYYEGIRVCDDYVTYRVRQVSDRPEQNLDIEAGGEPYFDPDHLYSAATVVYRHVPGSEVGRTDLLLAATIVKSVKSFRDALVTELKASRPVKALF